MINISRLLKVKETALDVEKHRNKGLMRCQSTS